MLEKTIDQELKSGRYVIADTAIDVVLKEDGIQRDAIEVHFFEKGETQYKEYVKYKIKEG